MKDNARKIIKNVIEENAVALKSVASSALYTKMNDRLKEEYIKVAKTLFDKKKINESISVSSLGSGQQTNPDYFYPPTDPPTSPWPQETTQPDSSQPTQQPTPNAPLFVDGNGRPYKKPPSGAPTDPKNGDIWSPGSPYPDFRWNGKFQRWEMIPTPSRVPRDPKPKRRGVGSGSGAPPR
jgi:hypothetical protein